MVAEVTADLRKPACRYYDSASSYWYGVAKKRKALYG